MKTSAIILPALLAPLGALAAPTPAPGTAGVILIVRTAEPVPAANAMLAARDEEKKDLEKEMKKDLEKQLELEKLEAAQT